MNISFLLACTATLIPAFRPGPEIDSPWMDPLLLLLLAATAALIAATSRTLPFQNVIWAALVIGSAGGLAHAIGTLAPIPFGPFFITDAAGSRLLGVLPWPIPLLWIVVILSSRGMAGLILQPCRNRANYGFKRIGLTVLLSLLFDLALEPVASQVNQYWFWGPTLLPGLNWHNAPITHFIGWTVTSLLVTLFVTPMLIHKKPVPQPVEYTSAGIWIALNLVLSGISWVRGLETAAVLAGITAMTASLLAVRAFQSVRGARR